MGKKIMLWSRIRYISQNPLKICTLYAFRVYKLNEIRSYIIRDSIYCYYSNSFIGSDTSRRILDPHHKLHFTSNYQLDDIKFYDHKLRLLKQTWSADYMIVRGKELCESVTLVKSRLVQLSTPNWLMNRFWGHFAILPHLGSP